MTEPETSPGSRPKPIDRWLALFATAVGVALYLLPKTELVVIACCALIWALLVHPAIKFWWIENRLWRQIAALLLLTLVVVTLGLHIRPEAPATRETKQKPSIPAPPPPEAPVVPNADKANNSPFTATVEVALATMMSGQFVTGFWFEFASLNGCSISPGDAVLYISITSNKPRATRITGYTVDMGGKRLLRLHTRAGQVFIVPRRGSQPRFQPGSPLHFPAATGQFYMFMGSTASEDFTRAQSLDMEMLDYLLGERYLMPKENVRGWAFFEFPQSQMFAPDLRVNITDEEGKTYSYLTSLKKGDPNADTQGRLMKVGAVSDISQCTIQFQQAQAN